MSITLDLAPETESRLEAQAAAQDLSVKDYIQTMLETLAAGTDSAIRKEQRALELDKWLNSHGYINAPLLSDEAISRESIYRDREDGQL